jgi:periplasmic protein TonB
MSGKQWVLVLVLLAGAPVAAWLYWPRADYAPQSNGAMTNLGEARTEESSIFEQGQSAFQAGRIFSPAGNNALELFASDLDFAASRVAAIELVPVVSDAIPQLLSSGEFEEAERLLTLLERVSPGDSYWKMVRSDIQRGRANKAAEQVIESSSSTQVPAVVKSEASNAESRTGLATATPQTNTPAPETQQQAPVPAASQITAAQNVLRTAAGGENSRADIAPAVAALPAARSTAVAASNTQSTPRATSTSEKANGNVIEPRLVSAPTPKYPNRARQQKLSGWVDLRLTVETDGSVSAVEVLAGDPVSVFDNEAVRAAKRWRFEPKTVDSVPTVASLRQRIHFAPNAR